MSLIPLAAPLIRLAATDTEYAQDLRDAVYDDQAFGGLVYADIQADDLTELTATQWLWYASWRQELGGDLNSVVLDYLTASATTPFARFEVRELVLRDRDTNERAVGADDDTGDSIGLNWLRAQARGTRIDDEINQARNAGIHLTPGEAFERVRDEALADVREVKRHALQCATEASWFLLRTITSLNDPRGNLVADELLDFARDRRIESSLMERWGLEPLHP